VELRKNKMDITESFTLGFFKEQTSNWKVKVVVVLSAIVALGVIGYFLN
jgi:hypothetical protein